MKTKTGDVIVRSIGDHTGHFQAINLKASSTEISSTCSFVAKKKHLLSFNDDTLRNIYGGKPFIEISKMSFHVPINASINLFTAT